MSETKKDSSIGYREAKRIIDLQETARDVINRYRGIEDLWQRMGLKSSGDFILHLFEVTEDTTITEVMSHLRALYPTQWEEACDAPTPEKLGELIHEETSAPAPPPKAEPVPEEELQPVG